MVTTTLLAAGQTLLSFPALLIAEKSHESALERMPVDKRAAVSMALLAITLIGLFLVILAMLGGHWVRRIARQRPRKSSAINTSPDTDDLELRRALQSVLPEAKTDDTMHFGKSSPDTKVGD